MSYHSRNASGSSHSSLLRLPSPIELDENHTFSKASLYPLDHTDYEPCRKRIINTSFGARQVIRFINHLETHDPVQHDAAVKRLIEIGVDVDDLVRLSKRRAEVPWEETWPYNWEKKEGLVLGYMKRNLPRWITIMKKTEAREAAEAMGETLEDDDSDDYITADEMAETEATQEDEVRPREEVEDGVDIEHTKDSTAKDEDIHAKASSPKSSMTLRELPRLIARPMRNRNELDGCRTRRRSESLVFGVWMLAFRDLNKSYNTSLFRVQLKTPSTRCVWASP